MNFNEMASSDMSWIFDEMGEEFCYFKQSSSDEEGVIFKGILDRNAQNPPSGSGYENQLYHELTFVAETFPLVPERGDKVSLRGKTYNVFNVLSNDGELWTINIR